MGPFVPQLGLMLNRFVNPDRLLAFAAARRLGFTVVHTSALPEAWLRGEMRAQYIAAARASGLNIAAVFVGFDGQSYADRASIARTVGLVQEEFRQHRTEVALEYSLLAQDLGSPTLCLHLGFLPSEERHPDYHGVVHSLNRILAECSARGQTLNLETGQESAWKLERLIRAVDHPALGVNFDPANFLIYGTDAPLTALDLLSGRVRGVHCKDAVVATSADESMGKETPIGLGQVPFEAMLQKLESIGYTGPLVIEREGGEDPIGDIGRSQGYLERLLRRIQSP